MFKNSVFIFVLIFSISNAYVSANEINQTTLSFVNSLSKEQKSKALFEFSDEQRFVWHYIPMDRKGLPIKQLSTTQKQLAFAILQSSLSDQGYKKAKDIIGLEKVLFLLSGKAYRDEELYYLSIFGKPEQENIWGWRFEGHHLSLNFTIKNGQLSSVTPNFWGANPAKVTSGDKQGLRVLKQEEDLGRQLINNLSNEQQKIAIIAESAYKEILTKNKSEVSPLANKGIFYAALTAPQRKQLLSLISVYLGNMSEEIAQSRFQDIKKHGLDTIQFAWAGSTQEHNRHYYRIQGKTFLIEYDNVQNNGNHIHTVWRDFSGDFGRDLLKEHHNNHQH
jgi:hypothetical protein